MGRTKLLYLPDNIWDNLQREENASALVSKLLNDHYNNNVTSSVNLSADELINNVAQEELSNNIAQAIKDKKLKEQKESVRNYLTELIGREVTKCELEDYLFRFRSGEKDLDVFSYSEELKKKDELIVLEEIEKSTTSK